MGENIEFVADVSSLLSFLMPDEKTAELLRILINQHVSGQAKMIAPKLLPYEVANTLRVGISRKRISIIKAKKLIDEFLKLGIQFFDVDFRKTITLAQKHNLSVYDASYLELARSKKAKLVSLDHRLMELI